MGDPAKMMAYMRDSAMMKAAWDKLGDDKPADKFPIGLFYKTEAIDYDTAYEKVIEAAQAN